jgi:lipopolysaccharide export system protein LptA
MMYLWMNRAVENHKKPLRWAVFAWLLLLWCHPDSLATEKSPLPAKSGNEEKIHITADRLVADTQNRFADFIGSVKVVQGATIITCDKLRIVYEPPKAAAEANPQQGAIKKLEAEGNVRIESQNKVAVAPRAQYEPATGMVVLSGAGSRVTDGPNSIAGDKITLFRDPDRMVVESGQNKRVEAIIYPENKSTP